MVRCIDCKHYIGKRRCRFDTMDVRRNTYLERVCKKFFIADKTTLAKRKEKHDRYIRNSGVKRTKGFGIKGGRW